jgi:hypothetical protein
LVLDEVQHLSTVQSGPEDKSGSWVALLEICSSREAV